LRRALLFLRGTIWQTLTRVKSVRQMSMLHSFLKPLTRPCGPERRHLQKSESREDLHPMQEPPWTEGKHQVRMPAAGTVAHTIRFGSKANAALSVFS
jgi:hypothetical protein